MSLNRLPLYPIFRRIVNPSSRWPIPYRNCHTVPPRGTGGLELTFLGTASQGGARRYPSALAMRLHGTQISEVWLFDCGEGALSQLQRSSMRISLVRNIFITHLHGDHLYGLPSMVLSILRSRLPEAGSRRAQIPLDVYGPQGLRAFLRMALGVAGLHMPMKDVLRVHELSWPEGFGGRNANKYCKVRVRKLPYEGEGRDLQAREEDGKFTFELISGGGGGLKRAEEAKVVAAPVLHTVPTYAYCVTEGGVRKRFDKEKIGGLGIAVDGSAREEFRKWLDGEFVEVEGKKVGIEDVLTEGKKARRICVIGDTYDASGCEHIAKGCDVIVHESTMGAAWGHVARSRGHSCSVGAATFAKRVGCRRLILNHVSVGYSERRLRAVEMEARGIFKRAFVARDLSIFSVPADDEEGDEFVFRRFGGYASKDEARDEIEVRDEGLFGGQVKVEVDELEKRSGEVDWEEEKDGLEDEEEEDVSWEDEEIDTMEEESVVSLQPPTRSAIARPTAMLESKPCNSPWGAR